MRIINCYYTVNRSTQAIQLVEVIQDGNTKRIEKLNTSFQPYFYSKRDIVSSQIVKKECISALNGTFWKYTVILPEDVKTLRQEDADGNCTDYEADILFGRRYIYDNNIDLGNEKLSKCYIDIETEMNKTHFPNPEQDAITFISLYSDKIKVVITCAHNYQWDNTQPKDYKLIQVNDERELLDTFFKLAQPYSMLIGWNSRQFDKPFIEKRSEIYGMAFNCINFVWADMLDLYRRFISSYTTGKTPPSSLSLDNVAKYVLGYGKSGKAVDVLQSTSLLEVASYNLNDSELVFKIDTETKLSDLVDNFGLVLNLLADDCDYFGRMIEKCIMREMKGRYIFKCQTKRKPGERHGIAGAYVHEPPNGILSNVVVFDFAGLYPNIIRSLNASPETIVDDSSTEPNLIIAPEVGHKFKHDPTGVFSKFITDLMVLRKEYKRLKAETHDDKYEPLQQMTKYLINAFYGTTAHETGRIYDKRIGESVTATGRFLIKELEKHFNVIYGDTDSVMIPVDNPTPENIKRMEAEMNIFVVAALKQYNTKEGFMNIRFEKLFDRVFFYGVKKRYYGRVVLDEDYMNVDKVVSRGLEIRRTDWCKAAVEYEAKLLQLVLYDVKGALAYHKEFVAGIRSLPMQKFVIYKTLTKPIWEYKNKPPHVRAATKIDWIGTKIGYVVTGYSKGKITAVERYEEDKTNIRPSMSYYEKKQVLAIYNRILAPLVITGAQMRLG